MTNNEPRVPAGTADRLAAAVEKCKAVDDSPYERGRGTGAEVMLGRCLAHLRSIEGEPEPLAVGDRVETLTWPPGVEGSDDAAPPHSHGVVTVATNWDYRVMVDGYCPYVYRRDQLRKLPAAGEQQAEPLAVDCAYCEGTGIDECNTGVPGVRCRMCHGTGTGTGKLPASVEPEPVAVGDILPVSYDVGDWVLCNSIGYKNQAGRLTSRGANGWEVVFDSGERAYLYDRCLTRIPAPLYEVGQATQYGKIINRRYGRVPLDDYPDPVWGYHTDGGGSYTEDYLSTADAPAPEQDATQQRLDDLADIHGALSKLFGLHRDVEGAIGLDRDPVTFKPHSNVIRDLAEQLRTLQQRVDKLQGGELREGEPWQARHALEALWAACGDERSRDALAAVRTELVHLWAVEQHAKEYIDKTNNSNRLALTECLDRGGVLLRGTQEPQPAAPGVSI